MCGNHSKTGSRFVQRKTAPKVRGGKVQRKNPRDVEASSHSGPLRIRTDVPRWPNRHVLREEDIQKFIGILPDWEELSRGLEEVVLADRDEEDVDGWYLSGTVAICAWPDGFIDTWPAAHFEEHRELLRRLGVLCRLELLHVCQLNRAYATELDAGRSKELLLECSPDHDDNLSVEILKTSHEWVLRNERDITVYSVVATGDGLQVYDVNYTCRFQESTARAYLLLHIFLHELGHHHDSITTPYKGWIVRGEEYAEKYAHRYERQIWDKYFKVFGA